MSVVQFKRAKDSIYFVFYQTSFQTPVDNSID
jgi:hypothetical protein